MFKLLKLRKEKVIIILDTISMTLFLGVSISLVMDIRRHNIIIILLIIYLTLQSISTWLKIEDLRL